MSKSTPEQLEEIRPAWEAFRKAYPGKTTKTPDWNNFVSRQTKPKKDVGSPYKAHEVVPLLMPALEYQIKARAWEQQNNIFVPSWKNLQTWITNWCWEEEHPEYDKDLEGSKPSISTEQKQNNINKRRQIMEALKNG